MTPAKRASLPSVASLASASSAVRSRTRVSSWSRASCSAARARRLPAKSALITNSATTTKTKAKVMPAMITVLATVPV